jgi:protein disulfide-isomerase
MKKLLLLVAASLTVLSVNAAELQWLTSLPDAQAQAKKDNKLVFMEFTGSDWCPPCKNLHKTVMESKEFAEYAKKNFVLVELDFPRKKEQSAALKKANRELASKFNIEGYPTVIVLDAAGKELHRAVGYGGTPAKEYVANLEKETGK